MASGQTMWGLDVGTCALKAMKIRAAADGSLELLALDYLEHEQLLSQPDVDREALIAKALETFLSRNDITDTPVVVGVPGQHTLARFSKLPPVEAKKIAEIVRYEAEQQIPFDMDEVIWDYQTFQEEDTPDIEVGIFAMKRDLVRDYLLHYENAGIEPAAVQSAPLALYNAAQFDGLLSGKTTVLLDIGADNTDLIVASPHSLWTRTIPLGGDNFTETLVKSFKLSFGKAENLKRAAASSKYARQIFQAMRPVFADLVQELQRSIGFYTSTHRDAEVAKVLGMGNAFKLPGLQKYLQQNLGVDVERPERFSKLVLAERVDVSGLEDNLLSFGVAYGLALQGLRQSKITTNLLPPEIARAVVWRKKRPFFGAAAACLLLTAGAIWARQVMDMSTLDKNVGPRARVASIEEADRTILEGPSGTPGDQARQILGAAQKLRDEYRKLGGAGKDELKAIDKILGLQRYQAVWFDILGVIHNALPVPQAELAEANTLAAYQTAVEADSNGLARSNRREIFIESFRAGFEVDLDSTMEELKKQGLSDLSAEANVEDIEGKERYGFLIRLRCRTPNENQVGFATEFKQQLRKLGRVPDKGFYINRVWMTWGEELAPSGAGTGERQSPSGRYGRRTSRGRRGRTGAPPPSETGEGGAGRMIYDPVTDELMNSDYRFDMIFDVVLENLPEEVLEDDTSAGEENEE